MRSAICVPVLGFCAIAAWAQTPANCRDVKPSTVERLKPGFASKLVPGQEIQPLHTTTLRSTLVEKPQPRHDGAGRIQRAIRALRSRIFPGKKSAEASRPSQTSFTLIDRSIHGAGFRFVVGKEGTPPSPCLTFPPGVR